MVGVFILLGLIYIQYLCIVWLKFWGIFMKKIGLLVLAVAVCLPSLSQARVSCKSFKTQAEAQAYYNKHKTKSLDRDGDGRACDCLPGGSGKNCPAKKKK